MKAFSISSAEDWRCALPVSDWATRVGSRFGTHAETYEAVTPVQEQMGEELLRLLARHFHGNRRGHCIDLGCGTGRLTAQFQESYPLAKVRGIDLSVQMVQEARLQHPQLEFCVADAERSDARAGEGYAVVFSNAMLQWAQDPVGLLESWRKSLDRRGCLVFATFVVGTFRELEQSFRAAYEHHGLPVKSHLLPLERSEHLSTGLALVEAKRQTLATSYSSLGDFLRALRASGAASSGGDVCPVPRRVFRSMREHYEEHFSDARGRVKVTYEVFYGVLGSLADKTR